MIPDKSHQAASLPLLVFLLLSWTVHRNKEVEFSLPSFLLSLSAKKHGGGMQQEAVMEGLWQSAQPLLGRGPGGAGEVSLPAALLMDRVRLHRSPLMRAAKGHRHG